MRETTAITCLFLDIGGVLLSNGWDHHARKRAATNFKLDGFKDSRIGQKPIPKAGGQK